MRHVRSTRLLVGMLVMSLVFFVRTSWAEPSGGIVKWSDPVKVVEPPAEPVSPEYVALAHDSQSLGLWATGGLSVTGAALLVAGSNDGSRGDMQGLGLAMLGTGVLFGPSMGWARAGYWDHAIAGAVVRTGIVGLGVGGGLLLGVQSGDALEGLGAVVLGTTIGVCGATLEGLVECGHMGPYIRRHGPANGPRVSLLTPHGPGVAVTLSLP